MNNSNCKIKRTTPLELPPTFSNRELSLLIPELSRKKAWQTLSRCHRYGLVKRVTSKPIDFWTVIAGNEKLFEEEIRRSIE